MNILIPRSYLLGHRTHAHKHSHNELSNIWKEYSVGVTRSIHAKSCCERGKKCFDTFATFAELMAQRKLINKNSETPNRQKKEYEIGLCHLCVSNSCARIWRLINLISNLFVPQLRPTTNQPKKYVTQDKGWDSHRFSWLFRRFRYPFRRANEEHADRMGTERTTHVERVRSQIHLQK